MVEQNDRPTSNEDEQKRALDKRLDAIGWALFLIMIGGLLLAPKESVPEGAWLIGVGLIILGVNAVRYVNAIKVSGFWIVVGIIALAAGASDFYGVDLPLFPIMMILIGVSIIIGVLTEKKPS